MSQSKTIAFITGANRGIGFETAKSLAEKGVHVVIGARDAKQGEIAAQKLLDQKLSADSIVFNVDNKADHKAAAHYFVEKFGRLDILVNNAGVMLDTQDASGDRPNTISTVSSEVLHKTFDTNFFSVVALTQE